MAIQINANCPLAIASDHAGFVLKNHLVEILRQWGVEAIDLGPNSPDSVDYPDFAQQVAQGIATGRYSLGVLICGSGNGMAISANRFHGIRAVVCTSAYMARVARNHNDANVLCLGERVIGFGEAEDVLKSFLHSDFEGGRHTRRINKIEASNSFTGNQ